VKKWTGAILRILLAVDGSPSSLDAAKYLNSMPYVDRLDITVLTVVGLPKLSLVNSQANELDQLIAQTRLSDEKTFLSIEKIFAGANTTLCHVTKQGHIGNCIVTAAIDLECELIVLGATGRSNHSQGTLGSVSEYVATHAMGSVLVVRSSPSTQPSHTVRRCILAYDDSAGARAAVHCVATLDWMSEAEIEVMAVAPINTVQHQDQEPTEHPGSPDELEAICDYVEKAVGKLRTHGKKATPRVIEAQHVGVQIAAEARARQADLIFLGAQGQSGIARCLLGSVAQYVVRHANQPVWIVRENFTEG
jgi:nucleotide-binding universal stress UspA family protein